MKELTLQAVANQSFSATLDGSRYDLTIKEAGGVMCVDVSRDGVALVKGSRIVAKTPLLPYAHQQVGNFVLVTDGDALPYYTEFGTTQALLYVSADEIAALRGT